MDVKRFLQREIVVGRLFLSSTAKYPTFFKDELIDIEEDAGIAQDCNRVISILASARQQLLSQQEDISGLMRENARLVQRVDHLGRILRHSVTTPLHSKTSNMHRDQSRD
jgi:hypothetical protein